MKKNVAIITLSLTTLFSFYFGYTYGHYNGYQEGLNYIPPAMARIDSALTSYYGFSRGAIRYLQNNEVKNDY